MFKVTIYTYNWSKERVENLHQQVSQLGYWLSARSSLLTSIVTQKMGLFHNQELSRKPPGSSSSSPGGLTQPAVTKSAGVKVCILQPTGFPIADLYLLFNCKETRIKEQLLRLIFQLSNDIYNMTYHLLMEKRTTKKIK